MKRHTYKIGIALITLSIGIVATSFWVVTHYSSLSHLMISLTIKPDESIKDRLLCEAVKGDVGAAKALVGSGEDIDSHTDICSNIAPSPISETLLMNAAGRGHKEIVELLLENGANLNAMNGWRDTPLTYAIRGSHKEIIRLLIDKGADIHTKGEYNDTPLMNAAQAGDLEVIAYLLGKGADVNARDKNNVTALMYAASSNQSEAMRLLLERGADPKPKDKDGRSVEVYLREGFPDEYINWKL